jgi:dTMP kinase
MGFLISIEGGDYTGKTTVLIPGLMFVLGKLNLDICVSREPGGTEKAEKIRSLIFEKIEKNSPVEELVKLFYKARFNHLQEVIKPFLGHNKEKDGIMIVDRYIDSTRVYQGLEEGFSLEKIFALEKKFITGFFPDLTVIVFIRDEHFNKVMQARKKIESLGENKHHGTRWDKDALYKHKLRQDFYKEIPYLAKNNKESRQFILVDSFQHPYEIIKVTTKKIIESLNLSVEVETLDLIFSKLPNTELGKKLELRWQEQNNFISS